MTILHGSPFLLMIHFPKVPPASELHISLSIHPASQEVLETPVLGREGPGAS